MRVVRLGSGLALDTSSRTHTLPVASEQCFLAGRCQMMIGMQNSKIRKKWRTDGKQNQIKSQTNGKYNHLRTLFWEPDPFFDSPRYWVNHGLGRHSQTYPVLHILKCFKSKTIKLKRMSQYDYRLIFDHFEIIVFHPYEF